MTAPTVLWPALLGLSFLVAGIITHWRELHVVPQATAPAEGFGVLALGPAFIAAGLAAFAGEHFTAAASLAQLVPKWMPGRLFIAYFVGVAHLAAALSLVARRYVRWSGLGLALMFALFVLLMDLPAAVANPGVRLPWILVARETTFAVGGAALFAIDAVSRSPRRSRTIATVARVWTACVLVFYGVLHLAHPEVTPGVPSPVPTAAWVPLPLVVAYATGVLLVVFGLMMFVERYASAGAAGAGLLMAVLTVVLYVPQFFLAGTVGQQVTAINFVFDTLLFGGTVLVIGVGIARTTSPSAAVEAAPSFA